MKDGRQLRASYSLSHNLFVFLVRFPDPNFNGRGKSSSLAASHHSRGPIQKYGLVSWSEPRLVTAPACWLLIWPPKCTLTGYQLHSHQ